MKKRILLAALFVGLAAPAFAQSDREPMEFDLKKLQRCEDMTKKASYKDQYEAGKFLARIYNTVRKQKDWSADHKEYWDPKRASTRHGIDGITGQAQMALSMWSAKMDKRPWEPDMCMRARYSIFEDQAWSGVHEGFVDYLTEDVQRIYFSLPNQ